MKFDDLTVEEIKDILYACKDLVDGNFYSSEDVEGFAGCTPGHSRRILNQINTLKELDID